MAPTAPSPQAPAAGPPLVVLITGCSEGGIGHALAAYLQTQRGARVFATVRRPDAAPQLERLGVTLVPLDVCDDGQCERAVESVLAATGGRLDIVVNNAGVVHLGPLCEVDVEAARATFNANVFGLLKVCQASHRALIASGRGRVVNVGSITGLQPMPLRGVYSASKAAVLRLTDALRLELAPAGVQVCYVAPGFVDTNIRSSGEKNCVMPKGGLWGSWLATLDRVMAPRLSKAVPVEAYARQLGDMITGERRLPRRWIGRTAGLEWLPRLLPGPLQDRVLSKALAMDAIAPTLRANAAALVAAQQEREREAGLVGVGGGGATSGSGGDGNTRKRR